MATASVGTMAAVTSKVIQKIYSQEQLSMYRKNLDCPENKKLITESVWFSQQTLLGNKTDMDDIFTAITKIYENRDKLA